MTTFLTTEISRSQQPGEFYCSADKLASTNDRCCKHIQFALTLPEIYVLLMQQQQSNKSPLEDNLDQKWIPSLDNPSSSIKE
jgi:hypothetical protein